MQKTKVVAFVGALAIGAVSVMAVYPQSAAAQTRGMERRDDRRDTRQESRSVKQECKASGESRSECRQEKRDYKQDGRNGVNTVTPAIGNPP